MAITEASLETNFNTYIADTSTDRISAVERLQFATEAVTWLQEETGNDHMVKTYTLNYFPNVHYYKVTAAIASLLEGADLRRAEADQNISATHRSSRELAEDIGNGTTEFEWAIERKDNDSYLAVLLKSKFQPAVVSKWDSITADGGTWAVDAVTSDASNLTVDTVEYKVGSGSLNFDIVAGQSVNNRSTISNATLNQLDLSDFLDLGAWIFWAYIPDVTNTTGFTLYWGSSSTAYWSASVTTEMNGGAWANGWNRVKVDWSAATMTNTPDENAIDYIRLDLNYAAGQASDTDYRINDLTITRPEPLTFYYTSWYVGTDTLGTTNRTAFTATSDIPYFSGKYDQYKYAVSHKMASLAFYGPLQVPALGQLHEVEAIKALNRVNKLIPKSVTKELKSFKVSGISFNRSRTRFRQ